MRWVALAALLLAAPARAQDAEGFRPTLEVGGLAQLDYRRAGAAADVADHEANPRRVRVGFSGEAAPRLHYLVRLEADNAASAGVLDASARYALADSLEVRFGQLKYDFDLAGRESPAASPLIDKPWVVNAVAGALDGAAAPSRTGARFRDRGLALSGTAGRGALGVRWSAGAFQGSGRRGDDNGAVTGVVRLQLSPAAAAPLLLSGGFLSGDTGDPGVGPDSPEAAGAYRAWTAGAAWDTPRLFARAEVYAARRERAEAVADVDGFYAEAVVTTHRDLDMAVRFQRLEDPEAVSAGAARSVDLGARWFFRRQQRNRGTSLSANLILRDAPSGARLRGFTLLDDGRGAALESGAELGVAFSLRLQVEF